nr:MAG TPA: hypothetical protein [Caudoviricetes sp.]
MAFIIIILCRTNTEFSLNLKAFFIQYQSESI